MEVVSALESHVDEQDFMKWKGSFKKAKSSSIF